MSQQQNQPNYEEQETGFEGLSESVLMEVGLLAPTPTSTRGSAGTRSEVQGRGVLCLWLTVSPGLFAHHNVTHLTLLYVLC